MGKQRAPRRQKKLDKGLNNENASVKKMKGKQRFTLKKSVARPNMVVRHAEKKQKAVGFNTRTDIAGARITPNHAKTSY